MKNLTRSERHELADLLEQARLYKTELHSHTPPPPEPDWAEVEAWSDRLREEAGPTEPTSYAARFVAKQFHEGRLIDSAEWARSYDSNAWHALDGSREDGLFWDQLIESYDAPEVSWTIEIINPTEA